MSLTDTAIRAAKPSKKPVKVFDGRGLFLLVTPTGSKWWRWRYRFGGKEKQLSFGVYPDISLAEARELRDQSRSLLADGIDPSENRKMERAAKRAEELRQISATRFTLDNDGALSFRLGNCRLTLTPAETLEIRTFLDATRGVTPKVTP